MFCTAQLLYFTLYDEVYENVTTFIHHPLYHPGPFQLSCHSIAGLGNNGRWIFSTPDNDLINISHSENDTLNVTIDGKIVPVTFQATKQSSSVTVLLVSHVIPGTFVCQSDDFSLLLRVRVGM